MSKKVQIILLSTLGAIFLALALYKVYSNVTAKKAFEIQVVNETSSSPLSEAEDLKIKKAKYYSIYSNGILCFSSHALALRHEVQLAEVNDKLSTYEKEAYMVY